MPHASRCIICEYPESGSERGAAPLLPREVLSPVSSYGSCRHAVRDVTSTSTNEEQLSRLPATNQKQATLKDMVALSTNAYFRLSWKCKNCKHYNSRHSIKCSFCVKYCNNNNNSINLNDSSVTSLSCSDQISNATMQSNGTQSQPNLNMVRSDCSSSSNVGLCGVSSQASRATGLDNSLPPVEEVERPLMVENNLYFLGRGTNLLSRVSVDAQGNVSQGTSDNRSASNSSTSSSNNRKSSLLRQAINSPKNLNEMLRHRLNSAVTSLVERPHDGDNWLCIRCTFRNPADFEFCEACDAPRNPNIPTTLPRNARAGQESSPKPCAPGREVMKRGKLEVPVIDLSSPSNATEDISDETLLLKQMWTCTKCSYACNPKWSKLCDMCNTSKNYISERTREVLKQNLDDDFQILTTDIGTVVDYSPEWTCVKCTLLNSGSVNSCTACDGSRLKSISTLDDMTLKRGEFWTCVVCTLKNALSSRRCKACKARVDGSGGTRDKLRGGTPDDSDLETYDRHQESRKGNGVLKTSQSFDSATNSSRRAQTSRSDSDPNSCHPDQITADHGRTTGAVPKSTSYTADVHPKAHSVSPDVPMDTSDPSYEIPKPYVGAVYSVHPQPVTPSQHRAAADSTTVSGNSSGGTELVTPMRRVRPDEIIGDRRVAGLSWTCSACTYSNTSAAVSCAMCGSSPTLGDLVSSCSRPGNDCRLSCSLLV